MHLCGRLLACLLLAAGFASGTATASTASSSADSDDPCSGVYEAVRMPLAVPSAPQPTKPWNILLYAAADFENALNPLRLFALNASSGPQANVLILEDQYGSKHDVIWLVDPDPCTARITPVRDLGEVQTDEPEALEQFLQFAKEWFPSERTLLYLYGHGAA